MLRIATARHPARFCIAQAGQADEIGEVGVRRQLLLVSVGTRQRVLAAEILDMTEPVAEHALRDAASQMRADPPKDHADLVLRVILDRQAPQYDKASAVLDLMTDFVDDRPQRRNPEMLATQAVERHPRILDPPHGVRDVAELRRCQLNRVIGRRFEIGHVPGAWVIDLRAMHRRGRRVVVTCDGRLESRGHGESSLAARRETATLKVSAGRPAKAIPGFTRRRSGG
jgi:hypothetical protein